MRQLLLILALVALVGGCHAENKWTPEIGKGGLKSSPRILSKLSGISESLGPNCFNLLYEVRILFVFNVNGGPKLCR